MTSIAKCAQNERETIEKEGKMYVDVLRGYCINPGGSTNLDKETLYYLVPHNKSHFYASKFPSGKRSHMGVYQMERFKIVREERVLVDKPKFEDIHQHERVQKKDKQKVQNQIAKEEQAEGSFLDDLNMPTAADVEGEETSNPVTVEAVEKPVKSIEDVRIAMFGVPEENEDISTNKLRTVNELPFAKEFNLVDDSLEPSFNVEHGNLKHAIVYKAKVAYRRPVFASLLQIGDDVYLKRGLPSDEDYNERACSVYSDMQMQQFIGNLPLNYFKEFNELDLSNTIELEDTTESTQSIVELAEIAVEESVIESVEPLLDENSEPAKEVEKEHILNETISSPELAPETQEQPQVDEPLNLFDGPIVSQKKTRKKKQKQEPKQEDSFDLFSFL